MSKSQSNKKRVRQGVNLFARLSELDDERLADLQLAYECDKATVIRTLIRSAHQSLNKESKNENPAV